MALPFINSHSYNSLGANDEFGEGILDNLKQLK